MNSKNFLLAICALSLAFVSCSNDEPKDDGQTAAKVKHVECTVKIDLADELFNIADVTISYIDNAGDQKSEVVTTMAWEKNFIITTFPYEFSPTISLNAKSNIPVKESYNVEFHSTLSFTTILTDEKKGLTGTTRNASTISGVKAEYLDAFFERHTNVSIDGRRLNLNSDSTNIVANSIF